jgi:superfamily I DNA/RNA helicase
VIAEVYSYYQNALAANNALDFDDLILLPVKLFQQNEHVLGYWHQRFHHILVDEYQDTNRIQYELIHLLVTNGEMRKSEWDWRNRSVLSWVTQINPFTHFGWQISPFCWSFNKTLATDCRTKTPARW